MSNSTYFLLLFNESAIIIVKGIGEMLMNQEYQVLVVLDLLVTQMNKFASRKLKPYGIKFNELNIIRFIEKADGPVYQKQFVKNFSFLIQR